MSEIIKSGLVYTFDRTLCVAVDRAALSLKDNFIWGPIVLLLSLLKYNALYLTG